jgi:hypothetical protein
MKTYFIHLPWLTPFLHRQCTGTQIAKWNIAINNLHCRLMVRQLINLLIKTKK